MAEMQNNRWIPSDQDFAVRVEVDDLAGFFSKKLLIEPGVAAMVLDNGQSVGKVPSGLYTLESFAQRLAFWSSRRITAILTRENAVFLELSCDELPTREMLLVDVRVRVGIQVDDVALFQRNLLGAKAALTMSDLDNLLRPIARQAIWETIGRLSIRDLTGKQARADLELCMSQAFGTSLLRAGLKFTEVQTLSVAHPQYDEQRRRVGELWLQREGLEFDEQKAQLAADERLAAIRGQERTDELDILAQQVAADRMEGEVATKVRRVGIRKSLREAILADKFAEGNAEEQLAVFRQQVDTQKLLREDEYQSLVETVRARGADRDALRQQLLRRLEIEQQAELAALRLQFDHAQKVRTRQAEIELTKINDDEASRRWRQQLEKEAAEASQRHDMALQRIESDRQVALRAAQDQRDEALKEVLSRQEIDRSVGEIELARAQRAQRMATMELEIRSSQQQAEIDLKARRAHSEREINRNEQLDQLERLRQVQQLNIDYLRQEAELRIREKQVDAEIIVLREDKASQREIARLQSLRGMSDIELVAGAENASVLADLLKHRASEQTTQEVARANALASQLHDGKLEELRQRLQQAESQAAQNLVGQKQRDTDQTIALMREMLLNQQEAFGKFGTNLEHVTRNLGPQHPQVAPQVIVVQPPPGQPGAAPGTSTDGPHETPPG